MSILKSIKKPFQIKYLRVYIATRKLDNTYDAFVRIPDRYIKDAGIGKTKKSVDSSDFDVGYFEESNVTLKLDNFESTFTEGCGFFENRELDRSKVQIVAGYYDVEDKLPDFVTSFEGIIDDRGANYNGNSEEVVLTIMSHSSIIKKLAAIASAAPTGATYQNALYTLLNRAEVTNLLTVDIGNINPKVNDTIDYGTWFAGKQLDEAIKKLLLASNSVMDITNNIIIIKPRTQSDEVQFEFFGKGASNAKVNIEKLQNITNGKRRIITRLQINEDGDTYEAPSWIQEKFGAIKKTLDLGFITTEAKYQTVAEDVLDEFQIPKEELELVTDYIGDEVSLLDMITIDNEGYTPDTDPALYDQAEYDSDATYVKQLTGIKFYSDYGYKILGIEHDFNNYSTKLKLRMIGQTEGDGILAAGTALYESAIYDFSVFTA